MATQFDPIAKDESLNTTENTPRNIADVLAEELSAIEQAIAGGSGSGGHTIVNASGTDMTQRAKMQFVDAGVTDDSANDKTKVEIVQTISAESDLTSAPDGVYQGTWDESVSDVLTADMVGYGAGTVEDALDNGIARQFFSEPVMLGSLTWAQAGKYYSTIPTPAALTGKTLLAVNISDWDELSASVLLNLYIRENNTIGILSSTGTFSNSSYIKMCLLYR